MSPTKDEVRRLVKAAGPMHRPLLRGGCEHTWRNRTVHHIEDCDFANLARAFVNVAFPDEALRVSPHATGEPRP